MDTSFEEATGIPIPTPNSFAAEGTHCLHIVMPII
jgi:hypothetical protein